MGAAVLSVVALDGLREVARDWCAEIAREQLGEENLKHSRGSELRWGRKGSRSLNADKGLFYDFEQGEGYDTIGFVQRERGCGFLEAVQWISQFTGFSPNSQWTPRPHDPEADRNREIAAEAERAHRIEKARDWLGRSRPIRGTMGEYYLTKVRGIPRPKDGWPRCVAWHDGWVPTGRGEHDLRMERAIVFAATLDDERATVQAIQREHLGDKGEKLSPEECAERGWVGPKRTNGDLKGAAVRLPGDPAGPLILVGGNITALSVWASTGYATWATLGDGNIHDRDDLPQGRDILIARDDDPLDAPSEKKFAETLQSLREDGYRVGFVFPWETRRGDKSDLNNLICERGPDAVRERIEAALAALRETVQSAKVAPKPKRSNLRAFYAAPEQPREQALETQRKVIRVVMDRMMLRASMLHEIERLVNAEAGPNAPEDVKVSARRKHSAIVKAQQADALRTVAKRLRKLGDLGLSGLEAFRKDTPEALNLLITGSQGSGKTAEARKALEEAAERLGKITDLPPRFCVVFTEPSLAKCDEECAKFLDGVGPNGLPGMVVRGMSAPDPETPGTTMCRRPDVMTKLAQEGVEVAATICDACPFKGECGTRRQAARIKAMGGVGLFFASAEYNHLPAPMPDSDLRIIDECATIPAVNKGSIVTIDLDKLARILESPATGRVEAIHETTHATLGKLAEALRFENAMNLERVREAVTEAGLQHAAEAFQGLIDAERARIEVAAQRDPADDAAILKAIGQGGTRKYADALAIVQGVLDEFHQPRRTLNGVYYDPNRIVGGEEQAVAVVCRYRPIVNRRRGSSTLILDGTGDPGMNSILFEGLRSVRIAVERDAFVIGTEGRRYSNRSLKAKDDRLRADIDAIVRRSAHRSLVVAPKDAKEALIEHGVDAEFAHFNYLRGRNDWEHLHRVVVVGVNMPPLRAIEDIARAYCVNDPEPFFSLMGHTADNEENAGWDYEQWPCKASRMRRLPGGSTRPVEVEVHPDPRAQRVLEQMREAEVLQAIDRVRPIYNHREIIAMNDLCLDLTYYRTYSHADLVQGGTRPERIFDALGGIFPLGKRDLVALYPKGRYRDGFAKENTAKGYLKDFKNAREKGWFSPVEYLWSEPLFLATVRYRIAGKRGRWSSAWVDLARNPDPATALTALLGKPVEVKPVEASETVTEGEMATAPPTVVEKAVVPASPFQRHSRAKASLPPRPEPPIPPVNPFYPDRVPEAEPILTIDERIAAMGMEAIPFDDEPPPTPPLPKAFPGVDLYEEDRSSQWLAKCATAEAQGYSLPPRRVLTKGILDVLRRTAKSSEEEDLVAWLEAEERARELEDAARPHGGGVIAISPGYRTPEGVLVPPRVRLISPGRAVSLEKAPLLPNLRHRARVSKTTPQPSLSLDGYVARLAVGAAQPSPAGPH